MTRQAARGLVISAAILILVTGARLPATNASREVDGQASIIAASWAWTLASPAGFGDCLPVGGCDNVRIRALGSYGGRLYAGTTNVATGALTGPVEVPAAREVPADLGQFLKSPQAFGEGRVAAPVVQSPA